MELLQRIKLYLDVLDNSKDTILDEFINIAKDYAVQYCHLETYVIVSNSNNGATNYLDSNLQNKTKIYTAKMSHCYGKYFAGSYDGDGTLYRFVGGISGYKVISTD